MEEARRFMLEGPNNIDEIIRQAHAPAPVASRPTARRHLQRSNSVAQPPNSSSPLSACEQQRDTNVPTSSPNTVLSHESPPGPARPNAQASDHRRVPSEAESLKENAGEADAATLMRRPEGQSRAFGNDITQFERDERKRSEDVAANRQQ